MREIKFRGIDIESGEWVYGFYYKCKHETRFEDRETIMSSGFSFGFDIVSGSAGQYIGRKDKNGKEIYCKDWIRGEQRGAAIKVFQGYIYYNQDELAYCLAISGNVENYEFLSRFHGLEVIGNKYENPELFEG